MEAKLIQQIKCRVCHQTKPTSEFIKDNNYKNGYRTECKECKQKRTQKYLKKWEEERTNKKTPTEKKCKDCTQIKPLSDYTKDKYSKDGLSHYCKKCKAKRHQTLVDKWKKERSNKKDSIKEKKCNSCNRLLPSSEFTSNIRSKDGLNGICKKCDKKRTQKYKKRWQEERNDKKEKINEKKCPSCSRILSVSSFYRSNSHKDGLSFYCKECELKIQSKHRNKWEIERKKNRIIIPKEKMCNICHRTLPASKFYKNRALKDGLHSACIRCEKNRSLDYRHEWANLRNNTKNPVDKECVNCHRLLPISMFYKNFRRKDGFTSSCIDCEKKRGRNYIDKWKEERIQEKKDDGFTLFPSFEKECRICKRVLPTSQFYRKARSKDGLSSNCIRCDLKLAKDARLKLKNKGVKREIPDEKFCKRCQRTLPASMFHRLWSSSDGLAMHCKDCKSEIYKEYLQKPGVKERLSRYKKDYRKRPGIREHERKRARKYARRPYVKEKRKVYYKEYYSRPEVKEHRKKYLKEYYSRLEVKERVKKYSVEYQKKKK